jgi:paraquat-inducible protein B
MVRKANPTLIGAFVVVGIALLVTAIVFIAGNDLFKRKDPAVMYFSSSTYGLQVGAPVVFRGVRVGRVTAIDVVFDRAGDRFVIPVRAELERNAVRSIGGPRPAGPVEGDSAALAALVQRGLSAQLQTQSLLTGLLYVDLDIRAQAAGATAGTGSSASAVASAGPSAGYAVPGVIEIPTTETAVQALRSQLEGMDFRRLAEDVSAIASSARAIVTGPELRGVLTDLQDITASIRRVVNQVDQRIDPLTAAASGVLANADRAAQRVSEAAEAVNATAGSLTRTSDSVRQLVAPDSVLMSRVQEAADEVALAAAALRETAGGEDGVVVTTTRAMQDLSRASRAFRELADTLDRQPQALLRGRGPEPPPITEIRR